MITPADSLSVIRAARRQLRLTEEGGIDEPYLGNALRRIAPAYCPCSPATLKAVLRDCLPVDEDDAIDFRLEECVEGLMIAGDLLEISRVTTSDPKVKGTWVFAGPPSFFVRADGSFFLFGIGPDDALPLPTRLLDRVRYQRYARILTPDAGEDLRADLMDLGFLEQKESAWLSCPSQKTAARFVRDAIAMRDSRPSPGGVSGLEILLREGPRRRWSAPEARTGDFVARRLQEFGAPLWCFVRLEGGESVSLIDLPLFDLNYQGWRGCDFGWQLQLALGVEAGFLPEVRSAIEHGRDTLLFDFPLPVWASRRLELVGKHVERRGWLLAYELSREDAAIEKAFLERMLWLTTMESGEVRGNHDGNH